MDADIAELPVAEALSDEKVLITLCLFSYSFIGCLLNYQPWLPLLTFPPQIKACAADKVEKEMEEMMECPEFKVLKEQF